MVISFPQKRDTKDQKTAEDLVANLVGNCQIVICLILWSVSATEIHKIAYCWTDEHYQKQLSQNKAKYKINTLETYSIKVFFSSVKLQ